MSSREINFGFLPPLPEGYTVSFYEALEHYMADGPDDWQSPITAHRFQARRWCFAEAAAREALR